MNHVKIAQLIKYVETICFVRSVTTNVKSSDCVGDQVCDAKMYSLSLACLILYISLILR